MKNISKQIISSKRLSAKNKFKKLIYYYLRKRGAERSWNRRHNSVLAVNKNYNKPCESEIETKHKQIWSVFRTNPDLTTLRISNNVSGVADPKIIPEDIFVADIEPSLITDKSVDYIGIKSFYNYWFPDDIFPKDLFHRLDGQYLSADLEAISFDEMEKISKRITYPVILKPNKDTYGGMDINVVNSAEELLKLAKERENFVVQEKIQQHDFFKKFNPVGLNTIRVYVYRSVVDNKLHVLSTTLRMGKGGSLDNESAGGIHCLITPSGHLNGYAVDKFCKKYDKHPDTGYLFKGIIPNYDQLKKVALEIAGKVFFSHIIGLDICFDTKNQWRVIEVNTKGHTIRFSQYGGQSFFGEFTDEVIDYCKRNHWVFA
jgi:hypothetical protein